MKSFEYTIKDELGIHARPAGMLVKEAKNLHRNAPSQRWKNEKADSADDANVTWCKAGRYRNRLQQTERTKMQRLRR